MKKKGTMEGFPAPAIWGVGVVLAATIALSALSVGQRETADETFAQGESPVVQEMDFTVTDMLDGTIVIASAVDGQVLEVVDRDSNGFLRGGLRGFARERGLHGVGSGEPFRLRLHEDGTLVLVDPTVGQIVALNGFGQDNFHAFGKYLTMTTGEKS